MILICTHFLWKENLGGERRIGVSGNDEGPFADKITLGQLGLELKQKFLYLYDFGAELKMMVQIEQVLETDVGLKPLILETRGEGPEEDW